MLIGATEIVCSVSHFAIKFYKLPDFHILHEPLLGILKYFAQPLRLKSFSVSVFHYVLQCEEFNFDQITYLV